MSRLDDAIEVLASNAWSTMRIELGRNGEPWPPPDRGLASSLRANMGRAIGLSGLAVLCDICDQYHRPYPDSHA